MREKANSLGLSKGVVQRLLGDEDQIQNAEVNLKSKKAANPVSERHENLVLEWINKCLGRQIALSQSMIMEAARRLAVELGLLDFNASQGWLWRFKNRNEIVYKKACGEKADADAVSAEKFKEEFQDLVKGYDPKDIYNADETGLFYRATPNGSLTFKKENLIGSKTAMDRVTLLVCSNMDGSDKVPLLAIGKSARPRCLRGINLKSLGIDYTHSAKAWMTSGLWSEWLHNFDKRVKRPVILFSDNCPAHPYISNLKNVKLIFLPPNTTSLIQPMDQGIIKSLKSHYKRKIVEKTVEIIECNDGNLSAPQIAKKIDLLTAFRMLNLAWDAITQTTIANCFRKAGFCQSTPNPELNDNQESELVDPLEDIQTTQQIILSEDFLTLDDQLQSRDSVDCKDQLNEVIKKFHGELEDVEEVSNDESEVEEYKIEPVSKKDALISIQKLEHFALQNSFDLDHVKQIESLRTQVMRTRENFVQTTLERFLK